MKTAAAMFVAFLMLSALVTTGCDKKTEPPATNDLRAPVGKVGTNDDGIKPAPVPVVQPKGGVPDDSIKPKGGVPDDSVRPVKPGGQPVLPQPVLPPVAKPVSSAH